MSRWPRDTGLAIKVKSRLQEEFPNLRDVLGSTWNRTRISTNLDLAQLRAKNRNTEYGGFLTLAR